MNTPAHTIQCIDRSKYPGASLITLRRAQKDTHLSEREVRKASAVTRIGRDNYVHIERVNEAIRRYEGSSTPTK